MATGTVRELRKTIHAARDAINHGDPNLARRLLEVAYGLTFRTYTARAVSSRRPVQTVTPSIRDAVKSLNTPDRASSAQEIADHYNLGTGGRVSEIWAGEYDDLK